MEKNLYDFSLSESKIKKLIEQFLEYMKIHEEVHILIENLEKTENEKEKIKLKIEIAKKEIFLKKLGDDMKFDNPFIWISYKALAYKWRKNEIATIWDFIKHCSWKTDICHRRYDFLNKNLKEKYDFDLEKQDKNEKIENLIEKDFLKNISKDEDFMKNRIKYEYFEKDWKVAKWENYKLKEV